MSLKEIEQRRKAELDRIEDQIDAAYARDDREEAGRLEAFRAKRAADYFDEMIHNPEYRAAHDGLRGISAALARPEDAVEKMSEFAGTLNVFSAAAVHLAHTVSRHGEKRAAKAADEAAAKKPASAAAKQGPAKRAAAKDKAPPGRKPGPGRNG